VGRWYFPIGGPSLDNWGVVGGGAFEHSIALFGVKAAEGAFNSVVRGRRRDPDARATDAVESAQRARVQVITAPGHVEMPWQLSEDGTTSVRRLAS
jgi:hypothetical protein